MSLKTWKEEFYPVDAESVSEEDALDHSLRKWIGLKPENLKKHGVFKVSGWRSIVDKNDEYDSMLIDGVSCSLCKFYLGDEVDSQCESCPLTAQRGGRACDESTEPGSYFNDSPYANFTERDDPQAMIDLIQGAIDARSSN